MNLSNFNITLLFILFLLLASGLFISCERTKESPNDISSELFVDEHGTIVINQANAKFGVKDDCIIGLILVGPKDDDGWSEVHYEAAKRVTDDLGCKLLTFESLNIGDSPDTTVLDVATMMVDQGADMLILSADTFEEDATVVAERFPSLAILQISGSNRLRDNVPNNLANSHSMQEISRFIAGSVAVRKAYRDSNKERISIGYLGPLINSETLRQASAAYLGARYSAEKLGLDPDKMLSFEVVWIGFWFNIPGVTLDPTEVSHGFFDRGVRVIISGIDTTEPIQVALSRHNEGDDVWVVGAHIDACKVGPSACIGTQFYDWNITYRNHIESLLKGTWSARWELRSPVWHQFTNINPGNTPVGFAINNLSEDEQRFIFEILKDLEKDFFNFPGKFPCWRGPLYLRDGELLVPAGELAGLLDVWFLSQLVAGIDGKGINQTTK